MTKTLLILLLIIITSLHCVAQITYRVMSYNVENLFDTRKSADKNDGEFLPTGKRYWTKGRYYHKIQQIAKVITAAGEWDTPALIGLCEVENDSVIHDLIYRTPLRKQDYRYCITTGKDERGINTALLYQRDKFEYLHHNEYSIPFTDRQKKSRNILHVSGRIITQDSLDVFVCHFPSRYGGEKESEKSRIEAAAYLRKLCDSIHNERENCLLLIMGDFNDIPQDKSLSTYLKAFSPVEAKKKKESELRLINLFYNAKGSHKHRDTWAQLDQIIVNTKLYQQIVTESIHIFSPQFLLTTDRTWRGFRPLRTYHGYKYEKGFSDHLPVIANFHFYK